MVGRSSMNQIQQIGDVIREYKTLLTQLADQPLPRCCDEYEKERTATDGAAWLGSVEVSIATWHGHP
jgi:hypothetical protein